MAYSTDDDLIQFRPQIMNNGVMDFTAFHQNTETFINTMLESEWYLSVAADRNVDPITAPFDPARMLASGALKLKYLSVCKVFEWVYLSLAKDTPTEDGYFQWATHYRQEFNDEWGRLLKAGIDYDWDNLGTITEDERFTQRHWNLKRC
jgi:hypothetical protein